MFRSRRWRGKVYARVVEMTNAENEGKLPANELCSAAYSGDVVDWDDADEVFAHSPKARRGFVDAAHNIMISPCEPPPPRVFSCRHLIS